MQKKNAFKIGVLGLLLVLSSLASVMYALAYTQKREVIYDNTITVGANEVKFRGFYLSSLAVMFEVKLTVSAIDPNTGNRNVGVTCSDV